MTTAFLTDHYELTMVDAALKAGTHDRESTFEVFARHLPAGRRYGVVAGTGRLLELIDRFRFTDAELNWLTEHRVVSPATIDWLSGYRFTGTIHGYREGELYFPGSPIFVVDAPFAEGVILETLILSVFNYDSAVAGAAARMVSAAVGRPLAEMGSRRANENAAICAARAAYIAGFSATSNLEAGRSWGVPTMGTAAHSFTLLHDSERQAFQAQVDAFGPQTTLLVDTYDIPTAIETAVEVAGTALGAVRIDSGDLPSVVRTVRDQLDSLGATKTTITVTSDLNEYAIAALSASPVDSYGVGTAVVTGSGSPAAGMVYKLVARKNDAGEWVAVAKKSADKVSVGGRKQPVRRLSGQGIAMAEVIDVVDHRAPDAIGVTDARPRDPAASDVAGRALLVPLIVDGAVASAYTGPDGVAAARAHHKRAIAELPPVAFRLGRGDPVLPTIYE